MKIKTIIITNKKELRQQKTNPKSYYSATLNSKVYNGFFEYKDLTGTWADIKSTLENLMNVDGYLEIELTPLEDVVSFTKLGDTFRAVSKGFYRDFDTIEDVYNFIIEKQVRDINTGDILVRLHNKVVDSSNELLDTYNLLSKSIERNLDFLGTIPHSNSPRPGWKKLNINKFLNEERDFLKDIDPRAIKYTIANLKKSEAEGVLSQYKKFQNSLSRARTLKEETKFWYQMFLSPAMAENNMKKFFQSDVRNNVSNFSDFNLDGEDGDDFLDVLGYQSNSKVKGDFGSLSPEYQDPSKVAEMDDTQDIFDGIFDLLDDRERMYLTAALVLGINRDDTRSYSKGYEGVDLRMVMKNPPEYELNTIEDKIEELKRDNLVPKRGFSLTLLLWGSDKSEGVKNKAGELLFPGKQRIPETVKSLQQKVKNLAGGDILGFLGLDEAKKKEGDISDIVSVILKGGKLPKTDLIRAIVVFVNLNKQWRTHIDTGGNLKSIANKYLKLAKNKSVESQATFYDLFLAPMIQSHRDNNPSNFLNQI